MDLVWSLDQPSFEEPPGTEGRLLPLVPGAGVERASLSVNLSVARHLGQEYRGLGDEVAVQEGEDGEGRYDHGEALPVDEGAQQVDRDQTETSEGRLYLEKQKAML